jgi:hypothetical protein
MVRLYNPFTPSEIAANPDDFFGRSEELADLCNSLPQGSVAIQGVVGIGKSSLLSRGLLQMEGFDSSHSSASVVAVGDKDIKTVDEAARLLLESFVSVDEKQSKITFKLGSIFETGSTEIYRNFTEGRHLAVLKRMVEDEILKRLLGKDKFLLLGIDEADKCPVPLARLVRSISTHTQHKGVKRVRFVLAGVSPFFTEMVKEDPGVNRFFYRTILLKPMSMEDATELIETKLTHVAVAAEQKNIKIEIDPDVIVKVVHLAGGHPHILQLLGSHLVVHESDDPDGIIDARDLVNSLRQICFDDRAGVYDSILYTLDLYGRLEELETLLRLADTGFPTRIRRDVAIDEVGEEAIQWFTDHQILSPPDSGYYGLVDEFLRIRFMLNQDESPSRQRNAEQLIIGSVTEGGDTEDSFDL